MHNPGFYEPPRAPSGVRPAWAPLGSRCGHPPLARLLPTSVLLLRLPRLLRCLGLAPLAAAVSCAWAEPPLQASTSLVSSPQGDSARERPVFLEADSLSIRPDLDAVAKGRVILRRAGTELQADQARYDMPQDQVRASGSVVIRRDFNTYKGPLLELKLQRFEGFFLQPEFELGLLGSGGRAERLDFIDSADAFCERKQGGVNLLCRGAVIAGVAKNSTVLVRLPYMSGLYWLTGAPEGDR